MIFYSMNKSKSIRPSWLQLEEEISVNELRNLGPEIVPSEIQ